MEKQIEEKFTDIIAACAIVWCAAWCGLMALVIVTGGFWLA